MKVIVTLCLLVILPAAMAVSVPTLPESEFADTEVSTNVAFNAERSDVRGFGVSMVFTGTASNCVQVAFGHDADGDGNLATEETGFVLGWRGGEYFIEDVAGGNRMSEIAETTHTARQIALNVKLSRDYTPKHVTLSNEYGVCFADLSGNSPSWIYSRKWNLMKVTRRGVMAASERIAVECKYKFFGIVVR